MAEIDLKNDFFNDESKVSVFKKIPLYDYTMTKFKAHKEWSVTSNDYNSSYNKISINQGLKPSDDYKNGIIPYNTNKYIPIPGIDPPYTDKSIFWYSLDHKYYKEHDIAYTIGQSKNQILKLYESSSFASISSKTYGEGIKKGSVYIVDLSAWTFIELIDDKNGNLIDKRIPTSSFIDKQNLMLYLGFNEVYDRRHTKIYDLSNHKKEVIKNGNVNIVSGINSTGIYTGSSGKAFHFNGSNSLTVKDDLEWYTMERNQDFSVSFWIKVNSNQIENEEESNVATLISKRKEGDTYYYNRRTKVLTKQEEDLKSISYPIHVGIYKTGIDAGKLFFERYDGENYSIVNTTI